MMNREEIIGQCLKIILFKEAESLFYLRMRAKIAILYGEWKM